MVSLALAYLFSLLLAPGSLMILEHYNGTTRILILAEIIVLKIQFHDEKKSLLMQI